MSFSEKAALRTAACSIEFLNALMDTGLFPSRGADRFTLHPTIAECARPGVSDEVHRRMEMKISPLSSDGIVEIARAVTFHLSMKRQLARAEPLAEDRCHAFLLERCPDLDGGIIAS